MSQNEKFVISYENPICPFCGHSSDGKELDGRWEIITCKKCGKNFKARTAKVYQTIVIKIGHE